MASKRGRVCHHTKCWARVEFGVSASILWNYQWTQVQLLAALKTQAKDDSGKTYWVYSDEDIDNYKQTSILDMPPSVSLAKNIKRNKPVFSLLNREIIESVTAPLYHTPLQHPWFLVLSKLLVGLCQVVVEQHWSNTVVITFILQEFP